MYTDGFLKILLECEKQILEPPSKEFKEDRGHLKKNFSLISLSEEFQFNAFIRKSIIFQENFSIGIDYNPKGEKGTVCLLRCNGAHGENRVFPIHATFHIHKASADSINSGLKPESNIEETNEYATFEEALQYFIKTVNLKQEDQIKYFPNYNPQIQIGFSHE
jgi:hypothetical protein